MATDQQIETITKHYIYALLWVMPGDDENENPGDDKDLSDLADGVYEEAEKDVRDFVQKCGPLFEQAMACFKDGYGRHPDAGSAEAAFGHDFALTRNGHGVGFWDREHEGLPKELGDKLSDLCKDQDRDLYIGDDGKVYLE